MKASSEDGGDGGVEHTGRVSDYLQLDFVFDQSTLDELLSVTILRFQHLELSDRCRTQLPELEYLL